MELNRIQPNLPVGAYTTYAISAPKTTHTRPATCAEIECEQWKNGWVTRVPAGSELARYIESKVHGRRFRETTGLGSAEREFMFPPGQPCFRSSQHVISLQREPFFTVRGGDWRRATTPVKPVRQEDWLESFGLNQIKLAEQVEKG